MTNEDNLVLYRLDRDLKAVDAISAPKIAILSKQNMDATVRSITNVIGYMMKYFQVTSPMTTEQAVVFAQDFIREYPTDTIEDLLLCLREARSGKYGKTYHTIDSVKLFDWWKQYVEAKYEMIERLNQNEKHDQYKVAEDIVSALPESVKESIKKPEEPVKEEPSMNYESAVDQLELYLAHYTDDQLVKLFFQWHRANTSTYSPGWCDEACSIINTELQERAETS